MSSDHLGLDCQTVFQEDGPLTRLIEGFKPRDIQLQMALEISQAIMHKNVLVVEAGTGVGKTFAYLVPSLLSGKKTLISTATKTLQDQLFVKDLPLLIKALKLPIRIQNLKGRANYICYYRLELYAQEGQFQTLDMVRDLILIREKVHRLRNGERGELSEIAEDAPVWSYVTSTEDNCLGKECSYYDKCFLVKARRRAMDAQIVVINHHLFFADLRLKNQGFSPLLPNFEVVIFDEAHQLPDIASHFYGESIGTKQCRDWIQDTLNEWPALDMANQPLKQLSHRFMQATDTLCQSLSMSDEKISLEKAYQLSEFKQAWQDLWDVMLEFRECFSILKEMSAGLAQCQETINAMCAVKKYFDEKSSDFIHWVERFKHNVVFHATPYDTQHVFKTLVASSEQTYVFTSATLTIAHSFDSFVTQMGMTGAKTLLLESPFNYRKQALMYLPRGLPDPKNSTYYARLLNPVLRLIEACQGRCFLLFTSHKAIDEMALLLNDKMDYPLLIQGQESKSILLAKFREYGNAVLLGTSTFWEGVDVKGDALSCVMIDKLPFANPQDPIIHGKMAHLKTLGVSGFEAISLPQAILMLKQGVGRLIRDLNDHGVLMIADPRLTAREYGKVFFESLPGMLKTRDENTVLKFIQTMGELNENSCT